MAEAFSGKTQGEFLRWLEDEGFDESTVQKFKGD